MKCKIFATTPLAGTTIVAVGTAFSGQTPYGSAAPNIPITSHDRVYTTDQFSNTVSVVDPSTNEFLRAIRLGDPSPANFSPLYKGQALVYGMGFAPDHRTIGVVSIGSNSVTFINTATNAAKHVTNVGRAPHEAFWTQDGKEAWVTVRGENYIDVLDGHTYMEKARIPCRLGLACKI
jgi:YVTN family beta-propeller protein